jgi:phosphatidylserine/phosphatidylglycerophosphate/cardiolipin synthase-like enzyme
LPFNAEYADLIDSLIAFLCQELVQVRLYPSFLHAKAYLFPQFAIVGSSNFTHLGLTRKAELNLVHKSDMVAAALRRDWFEAFWQDAGEYKDALVQVFGHGGHRIQQWGGCAGFLNAGCSLVANERLELR